jgi:hypothetical protein
MFQAASTVLRTIATPILGAPAPSPALTPSITNSPTASKTDPEGNPSLGVSVSSLSTADGHVDFLAVADYISCSVNAGIAVAAKSVFGYNLEFEVHKQGALLITGASGRVGAHAVRT